MKKLILLVFILLLAGCGNDEVEANGAKMSYEELLGKIAEAESELAEIEDEKKNTETEIGSLKVTLEKNKTKYSELEDIAANRDSIENEVRESENTLSVLLADIEKAKGNLAGIEEDIVKARNEPISVGAGYYTIGDDIPPGRFKLVAQEGFRGNVFVREDGTSKVAETFGGGEYGIADFVFQANMGDEIEATIPILLYPVE